MLNLSVAYMHVHLQVDNDEMRKKNRRARGGSEDPRGAPLPQDRTKSAATASP